MFKARMLFAKEGRAKFISHLDLMQTMQRSMARCEMPLWFTEGFNQHAYVSVALPLSTGFSGESEFLDFNLLTESVPVNAVEALNSVFPEGLRAIEIYPLSDGGMKLGSIAFSQYRITYAYEDGVPSGFAKAIRELFSRPVVEITKKSKRSEKVVNMRELMPQCDVSEFDNRIEIIVTTAAGNNNMSPEYVTKALNLYCPEFSTLDASYHRLKVFNTEMQQFR